ncbi:MAG: mechanosensitive ion channel [Myxococcales bacterium]|nr:mechanosensitive ion channel [Myxococcales bacterium]
MSWPDVLATLRDAFDLHLFDVGGRSIRPATLFALALVAFVTGQISKAFQQGVARAATIRGMESDQGSIAVAQRVVHYVVLVVGVVVALQILGIDLAALVAAGAVFVVGVGLAMQNLAQNFVSGLILLAERSIKPTDVVEVDGQVVVVKQMGIRSTIAHSRDGEDLIIPNSLLVQNTVKNLTHLDRYIRIRVAVGVSYDSDMGQVARVLMEAANQVPWRVRSREPILLWQGFGDSAVQWEISVWGSDPWRVPQMRTELARVVWDALKEAGITIAFPQLDVHLDAAAREAITGAEASRLRQVQG